MFYNLIYINFIVYFKIIKVKTHNIFSLLGNYSFIISFYNYAIHEMIQIVNYIKYNN